MALTDYSIDTSGTPEEVQRRQKLAEALMQQGGDTSPAAGGQNGGWLTAINRGLAGALGGYREGAAIREDHANRQQANLQLAALLGGGGLASQPPMGSIGAAPASPQGASQRAAPMRVARSGDDTAPDTTPAPAAAVADPGDVPRMAPDGRISGNLTSPTLPGVNPAMISYVQNPYGNKAVQSAMLTKALTPRDHFTDKKDADGNWYQVNDLTGQKTMIKGAEATPSSVREFEYAQSHPGYIEYQKNVKAPLVNIDQKTEGAQATEVGKALGKVQAADIEAGSHAVAKQRQLATLDDANKSGGDDISSGPFGKAILAGKQGLSELAGVDLKGLPESEVVQKVGFGLATNMVKAITQRPAQMEFMKALENVPGLFMSKQGRIAMTSIAMQEARAEQELGRLAARHRDLKDGPVWQEVKDKFYQDHPLISPFTGKPFSPEDVQMLVKQSPQPAGDFAERFGAASPGGNVTKSGVKWSAE